jgi:hypothetical protein
MEEENHSPQKANSNVVEKEHSCSPSPLDTEFDLSKKILKSYSTLKDDSYLQVIDVKEFIKRLKDYDDSKRRELMRWVRNWKAPYSNKTQLCDAINKYINNEGKDKLAGDKLVGKPLDLSGTS